MSVSAAHSSSALPPLLLCDVDGVLNCMSAPERELTKLELEFPFQLWLPTGADAHLRALCESFELRWATAWFNQAPRLLDPALGVSSTGFLPWNDMKLPAILEAFPDRAWAWIDDDADWELAQQPELVSRIGSNLVLNIDPARGLDESVKAALVAFASSHS